MVDGIDIIGVDTITQIVEALRGKLDLIATHVDYDKMVQWLVKEEGFTEEEAIEWIDYNTNQEEIC